MLLCEDVVMTWDPKNLINEQKIRSDEREAALKELRRREFLADMRFGRAIARERENEVKQSSIASALKLSREQVRRLENTWHDAVAKGLVSDTDLED